MIIKLFLGRRGREFVRCAMVYGLFFLILLFWSQTGWAGKLCSHGFLYHARMIIENDVRIFSPCVGSD